MADRDRRGWRAMVTGGARGIGLATAKELTRHGLTVILADLDLDLATAAAAEVGPSCRAVGLDVRDGRAFAALVERIEATDGPIDVLVNNAGIMALGPFLDQDPRMDDRQIDVNLRGVIHGMRAVLPGMLRRGRGHVVNVASVAGRAGVPYAAVYSATKHAVIGLSEATRQEVLEAGVEISYVLPTLVATDLVAGAGKPRWPPLLTVDEVAAGVWRAVGTGAVDVYVPRFSRIAQVIPAILPRPAWEAIGRWFQADRMFRTVDAAGRAAYARRIER